MAQGQMKFDTFEEARAALGIPEDMVNDANRPIIERLVKSAAPSTSKAKRSLVEQCGTLAVLDSAFAKEMNISDLKGENVASLKILVAHALYEQESDELEAFLDEQNWAFCERNGKLYKLKRKATPVEERSLPKKGSAGFEVMQMIGDEEFVDMEYSDIAEYVAKNCKDLEGNPLEVNEKTVGFYANFAKNRQEDCAELYGADWEYQERTSVMLAKYGAEMSLEAARASRRGRKAEDKTGTDG